MSRLGDSIRAARLKAKMTEKALGKKCGMAESVIKDIESGRRIVSDEQAQRILKLLGADSPVSTELDVAAEPEVRLRPRPRAYVLPLSPESPQQESAARLFLCRQHRSSRKAGSPARQTAATSLFRLPTRRGGKREPPTGLVGTPQSRGRAAVPPAPVCANQPQRALSPFFLRRIH